MAQPQLVIMAAGIGSRYGGLKQIDPIGPSGEIIIDYSIYDALKAGFGRVVFIIRHHFEEDFKEMIGRRIEQRAEVKYAFQELDALPEGLRVPPGRTKPWGTGHAALVAAPCIDAPSAIINADDYYGAAAFRNLYEYCCAARDSDRYEYCMVGYTLENTLTEHGHVARGVCEVDKEGLLRTVVERTKIRDFDGIARYEDAGGNWVDIAAGSTVSMNTWGVTPGFYGELRERFMSWFAQNKANEKAEFFLPGAVNDLLQEGRARVRVLPTGDRWYGVTYREDKPIVASAVRALIDKGVYPRRLWS
jgi:dTDP-glucose pyrophosphorylase